MNRFWNITLLLSAVILCPKSSISGELTLQRDYYSALSDSAVANSVVHIVTQLDADTQDKVRILENVPNVTFEFPDTTDALSNIYLIDVMKLPKNYVFRPFVVEVPFYNKLEDLKFILVSVNTSAPSKDEIIWLRQSGNPNKLREKKLFVYYARAFMQAKYVVENVQPGGEISRDNVKAIYSFLQSARQLWKKKQVRPDDLVQSARDWLQIAKDKKPKKVDNAVRTPNAEQILVEINFIQKYTLDGIWKNILRERLTDFERGCRLLGAFQRRIRRLSDEKLKYVNKGRISALTARAFANCLAEGLRFGKFDVEQYFGDRSLVSGINQQISYLEEQKGVAGDWVLLKAQIESDILVLKELRGSRD